MSHERIGDGNPSSQSNTTIRDANHLKLWVALTMMASISLVLRSVGRASDSRMPGIKLGVFVRGTSCCRVKNSLGMHNSIVTVLCESDARTELRVGLYAAIRLICACISSQPFAY